MGALPAALTFELVNFFPPRVVVFLILVPVVASIGLLLRRNGQFSPFSSAHFTIWAIKTGFRTTTEPKNTILFQISALVTFWATFSRRRPGQLVCMYAG